MLKKNNKLKCRNVKLIVFVILLLKCVCCDLNEYSNKNNFNNHFNNFTTSHLHSFRPNFVMMKKLRINSNTFDHDSISRELKRSRELSENEERRLTFSNREARGFFFHSEDNDVVIDMEFIVPFIYIPVKGTMNLMQRAVKSLLNLQSRALIWSGIMIIIGVVVKTLVSSLHALLSSKPILRNKNQRSTYANAASTYASHATAYDSNGADFISALEAKLLENNIDLGVCTQSFICNHVRQAKNKYDLGKATNLQRTLIHLIRTPFLRDKLLNGTTMLDVLERAQNKHRCY